MSSATDSRGASILVVDDEPNVLSALRRIFHSDGYDLHACTDAAAALGLARQTEFDLVISDYRMPETDGITFLTLFRSIQPDTPRLILSGYADLATLIGAINDAQIFRFVIKPWHDHELRATVRQALAQRALLLENRRLTDRLSEQAQRLERQESELRRLEQEHPGITRVRRGPDGAILIGESD